MSKKTWIILGIIVVIIVIALQLNKQGGLSGIAGDQTAAGGALVCSDTDGGVNTAVQGTASITKIKPNGSQTVQQTMTDSCANTTTLTEYSCTTVNTNIITTTSSPCAGGCMNGVCVSQTGGIGTGPDTTAPVVNMLGFYPNPYDPNAYVNSITVYASNAYDEWQVRVDAYDNVGIANVTFLIDGTPTVLSGFPNEPYQLGSIYGAHIESEIKDRGIGTHTVSVRVCDAANNCSTSATRTATVQASSPKGN